MLQTGYFCVDCSTLITHELVPAQGDARRQALLSQTGGSLVQHLLRPGVHQIVALNNKPVPHTAEVAEQAPETVHSPEDRVNLVFRKGAATKELGQGMQLRQLSGAILMRVGQYLTAGLQAPGDVIAVELQTVGGNHTARQLRVDEHAREVQETIEAMGAGGGA